MSDDRASDSDDVHSYSEPYLGTPAHDYYLALRAQSGFEGLFAAALKASVKLTSDQAPHESFGWGDVPVSALEKGLATAGPSTSAAILGDIVRKRRTGLTRVAVRGTKNGPATHVNAAHLTEVLRLSSSTVTSLDLTGTSVSSAALLALPPLPKLRELKLARCAAVSPQALFSFLRATPSLRAVTTSPVRGCAGSVVPACAHPELLTKVEPNGEGTDATSQPLSFFDGLRSLEQANVVADPGCDGAGPEFFAKLKALYVGCDDNLSESWLQGLDGVAEPKLEEFEMWCRDLSGSKSDSKVTALSHLLCAAASLRILCLVIFEECPRAAPEIVKLLSSVRALRELSLLCSCAADAAVLSALPAGLHMLRLNAAEGKAGNVFPSPAVCKPAVFASLTLLSLVRVPAPTAHELTELCRCAQSLEELKLAEVDLSGGKPGTIASAAELLATIASPSLRYLEVSNMSSEAEATDDAPSSARPDWAAFVNNLPALTSLLLYETPPLLPADLVLLSTHLLSVTAPTALGTAAVAADAGAAGAAPSKLRYLNITSDATLTAAHLNATLRGLRRLEVLQVEGCALSGVVELGDTMREVCVNCEHRSVFEQSSLDVAGSLAACTRLQDVILNRVEEGAVALLSSLEHLRSLTLIVFGDPIAEVSHLAKLSSQTLMQLNVWLAEPSPSSAHEQVSDVTNSIKAAVEANCPCLGGFAVQYQF